jgi:hypothetical protein
LHDIKNIPLTSSEISGIWNSYMNYSIAICLLKYFVNNTLNNQPSLCIKAPYNLSIRLPNYTIYYCGYVNTN